MSFAAGINAAGDVVGMFVDRDGFAHGFLAPAHSSMQDLVTPERLIRMALSITDDGRFAGSLYTERDDTHAFRTLVDGTIQDLGTHGLNSTAWKINAAGQVTGDDAGRAFRFSDTGGKTDLGTLGGPYSLGLAINSENVIVGCAAIDDIRSHAFRAREWTAMEDLGTLGGDSSCAEGINGRGDIVGWSDLANHQGHAFLYTDVEGMIDLNTRVPSELGLRLVFARAINDRGQIVAISSTLDGTRTYRLTPVERDGIAPVITSTSVTPATLWPPDGRMTAVRVSGIATDNVDPSPQCRAIGVAVLEAGAVVPGADETDVQITGELTLMVRARRSGAAARIYSVSIGCSDSAGNTTSTTVSVTVPHDSSGAY